MVLFSKPLAGYSDTYQVHRNNFIGLKLFSCSLSPILLSCVLVNHFFSVLHVNVDNVGFSQCKDLQGTSDLNYILMYTNLSPGGSGHLEIIYML